MLTTHNTQQRLTTAVRATVTGSQPCALSLPCLFIGGAPLFTSCHDHKEDALSLAAVPNHNSLHLPAAFDVVLGEAMTAVFVVDTTHHQVGRSGSGKVNQKNWAAVLQPTSDQFL